jgi:hypothetical protein
MSTELLRASEAARRLDIPTKELLRLVHGRRIHYELVEGIGVGCAQFDRLGAHDRLSLQREADPNLGQVAARTPKVQE